MNLLWTPHNRASLGVLRAQIPTVTVSLTPVRSEQVAAFKVEVDQAIEKAQKMMNRGEI